MPRAVAFIRNVMVGRDGLTRDVLLTAIADAGGRRPRSYLSTGNVSFDADDPWSSDLIGRAEDRIEGVLGRREPILIRTVEHLTVLVDRDPYSAVESADIHERCVTFLPWSTPWRGALPVTSARGDVDVDVFAAEGADVFSVTRLVGGRPGTAGPMVERKTGKRVTTRNWKTIERILRSPA